VPLRFDRLMPLGPAGSDGGTDGPALSTEFSDDVMIMITKHSLLCQLGATGTAVTVNRDGDDDSDDDDDDRVLIIMTRRTPGAESDSNFTATGVV